jgi:hypothetical protein
MKIFKASGRFFEKKLRKKLLLRGALGLYASLPVGEAGAAIHLPPCGAS